MICVAEIMWFVEDLSHDQCHQLLITVTSATRWWLSSCNGFDDL